jgi:hypothetical protein
VSFFDDGWQDSKSESHRFENTKYAENNWLIDEIDLQLEANAQELERKQNRIIHSDQYYMIS